MSDSGTEWRAEHDGSDFPDDLCWIVAEYKDGRFSRILAAGHDKPTAHRIAAVNELEAALDGIVADLLEGDFVSAEQIARHAGKAALAKARGDQ